MRVVFYCCFPSVKFAPCIVFFPRTLSPVLLSVSVLQPRRLFQVEGEHLEVRVCDAAAHGMPGRGDVPPALGVDLGHTPRPRRLPVQRPLRLGPHAHPHPRHHQTFH